MSDFVDHQIMEMRVKSVERPVNGHCHMRKTHLVDEGSNSGSSNVRSTARNDLTDIANVGAVFIRSVFMAQFFKHLAAASIFSLLIAEKERTRIILHFLIKTRFNKAI